MFKKIIIRTAVFAAIVTSVSFFMVSCQKENATPSTPTTEQVAVEKQSSKVKNTVLEPQGKPICTPSGSVLNITALNTVLNNYTCFNYLTTCNGPLTITTQFIGNINLSLFPSTVATQQDYINKAKSAAILNAPAGSQPIKITYTVISGNQIKRVATYQMCY